MGRFKRGADLEHNRNKWIKIINLFIQIWNFKLHNHRIFYYMWCVWNMYAMAWKVVGINFITVIFTLDYVERKEREKNIFLSCLDMLLDLHLHIGQSFVLKFCSLKIWPFFQILRQKFSINWPLATAFSSFSFRFLHPNIFFSNLNSNCSKDRFDRK